MIFFHALGLQQEYPRLRNYFTLSQVSLPRSERFQFQLQSGGSIWKPVALALLLLPLGVWRLGARQKDVLEKSILSKCSAILKPLQQSAAVKAGHPAPVVSLNWLHASVTGVVSSLAEREGIRQGIDALGGVQCRESEIAGLRVAPHVEARRDGGLLVLSGELPMADSLAETVALMQRAEPGLKVDATAVMVHPSVLSVAVPQRVQDAADDPLLGRAWQQVKVAWPVVEFDFSGDPPRLAGRFPDKKTRDAVVAALRAARPDLKADDSGAAVDPVLPPVEFKGPGINEDWQPPSWLKPAWEKWTVYPSLSLRVDSYDVKIEGIVSSPPVLNTVLTILHRLRPDLEFAKGGVAVRNGSLDKPLLLPANLKDWTPPPWLRPLLDQASALPVRPRS
ncbi:MAG: hypothetical protein JWL81_885 [Verrucomicrobiales bacterium]|nr:hypothetical protein [Verrucomicrobiales bacterium]